jgi:hypothetical protein
VGGRLNTIEGGGDAGVIAGGDNNIISGASNGSGFIGAGYGNSITAATGRNSFIGAGYYNEITATFANNFIGGGETNIITGTADHNFIGGGQSNLITDVANAAIPGGEYGQATIDGEFVHNSTNFVDSAAATRSTFQGHHLLTGNVRTADAVSADVLTIPIVDETALSLDIKVVGNQDASADRAMFFFKVGIERSGAGVPTIVGQGDSAGPFASAGAVAWTAVAAISGNNMVITVTGAAGDNVLWGCVAQWTGVGSAY